MAINPNDVIVGKASGLMSTPRFVGCGMLVDNKAQSATLFVRMDRVSFLIEEECAENIIQSLTLLLAQLHQARAQLAQIKEAHGG